MTARSIAQAVRRYKRQSSQLDEIDLFSQQHTDEQVAELVDCMLAQPDLARRVYLGNNQLTDETGVKLARYLAASTSVEIFDLRNNRIGETTYLALAAALRVNTSLQHLYLHSNTAVEQARVGAAFVEALRLNPDRPICSMWSLFVSNEFKRLKAAAEELGHPTLLMVLLTIK